MSLSNTVFCKTRDERYLLLKIRGGVEHGTFNWKLLRKLWIET